MNPTGIEFPGQGDQAREVTVAPPSGEAIALPKEVLDATQELFPGRVELEVDADPEDPGQAFLVITVEASGDVGELVHRRGQWHDRVRALLGCRDVRLSIVPR